MEERDIAMTSTPQALVDSRPDENTANHHHFPHTRQRLRQFLRPDGRKVLVAASPEEASQLRKTLSFNEQEGPFDLVIQGSSEHIDALRYSHQHHEEQQKRLREENPELAERIEATLRELDVLNKELHMAFAPPVRLDTNFNKYGYSAELRARESKPAANFSAVSTHSVSNSPSFDKDAWAAQRKLGGSAMPFYARPVVRQYFHKGLLWRAREAQEVASYELFIDLFYVGIVAVVGDHAAEHPSGEALLHFSVTFVMGWKFWSDISLLISWFESDDFLRRCSVLFVLACLLGFATNMTAAFETTWTPLVAFYLAARLFIASAFAWYAYALPMVRASMLGHSLFALIPSALWIASIHVALPTRHALIWPALLLDTFGGSLLLIFTRPSSLPFTSRFPRFVAWASSAFEFVPGANIEHRIERTGAFVTLVFGSCVLGLFYQSDVGFGVNGFFGKAVMGLLQAFAFNWIYFEMDSWNLHTHAIRRSVPTALLWFTLHLPFIMSFVLGASTLGVLVRAHDSPSTPFASLHNSTRPLSSSHLTPLHRYFYASSLGTALLCTALLAHTHVHRTMPGQILFKNKRLLFRLLAAVVMIVLPRAAPGLDSVGLVGAVTGILVAVVAVEVVGAGVVGEGGNWRGTQGDSEGVGRQEVVDKTAEDVARADSGDVDVEGGLQRKKEDSRGDPA